jgi:hypothetical protein
MNWQRIRTLGLDAFEASVRATIQTELQTFNRYVADFRNAQFQLFTCSASASGALVRKTISISVGGNPTPFASTSLCGRLSNDRWTLASADELHDVPPELRIENVLNSPTHAQAFFKPIMSFFQPFTSVRSPDGLVVLVDTEAHADYVEAMLKQATQNQRFHHTLFLNPQTIVVPPSDTLRGYAFFSRMADTMQTPGDYLIIPSHRSATVAAYDGIAFTYMPFAGRSSENPAFRNYLFYSGEPLGHVDPEIVFCTKPGEREEAELIGYIRWTLRDEGANTGSLEILKTQIDTTTNELQHVQSLKNRLLHVITRIQERTRK